MAKTFSEALAEEARRGDEHRAQIRAEGWRAGAEAMRREALTIIGDMAAARLGGPSVIDREIYMELGRVHASLDTLDIPEIPNDR